MMMHAKLNKKTASFPDTDLVVQLFLFLSTFGNIHVFIINTLHTISNKVVENKKNVSTTATNWHLVSLPVSMPLWTVNCCWSCPCKWRYINVKTFNLNFAALPRKSRRVSTRFIKKVTHSIAQCSYHLLNFNIYYKCLHFLYFMQTPPISIDYILWRYIWPASNLDIINPTIHKPSHKFILILL